MKVDFGEAPINVSGTQKDVLEQEYRQGISNA